MSSLHDGAIRDGERLLAAIQDVSAGGGLSNYYLVQVRHPQRADQRPYQAECEDIIEALGLTFDEGNIFKEIWRSANARKGNGKAGNTPRRGAEKILHYAQRIYNKMLNHPQ